MNKAYPRREFLKITLGALAAAALPLEALSATLTRFDARRMLSFYNTHTEEKLRVCYFEDGAYRPESLDRINHILRDHRSGLVKPIDVELLDLLYSVQCRVRPRTPFHIISGYRSPTTNEWLRRFSSDVARTSFHTKGQAIDIRLPGYSTTGLRNLCVKMRAGGVGYYSRSDFVHLDVGPVRAW